MQIRSYEGVNIRFHDADGTFSQTLFTRKLFRFFTFWQKLARRRTIRHRRKTLAETIGTYAIKARCFARIKLFIQNYKRIEGTIGIMHARGRYFKLAGTHLREFRRINNLRIFYHRYAFMTYQYSNDTRVTFM